MKKFAMISSIFLFSLLLSACDDLDLIKDNVELGEIYESEDSNEIKVIEDLEDEDFLQKDYEYTDEWGSLSALDTEILTLENMLVYAIQDEYSAYAEYEYILANFDVTKPFSNIINAEASHIESLLPLFEIYDIQVPYNDAENHLLTVIDLEDTFRTGVLAEILNIDMYNLFLEQDLPTDVKDIFINLRDASIKHLAAFEKNLATYE